jgi:hypothetical protein
LNEIEGRMKAATMRRLSHENNPQWYEEKQLFETERSKKFFRLKRQQEHSKEKIMTKYKSHLNFVESKQQHQNEIIELKRDLTTKLANHRCEMKNILREADTCLSPITTKKKKNKANDYM